MPDPIDPDPNKTARRNPGVTQRSHSRILKFRKTPQQGFHSPTARERGYNQLKVLEASTRQPRRTSLWDRQGALWIAFAFAGGILVYGLLPDEPSWAFLTGLLTIAGAAGLWTWRLRGLAPISVLGLAFLAGLALAAVRTAGVETPKLAEPVVALLSGQVLSIEKRGAQDRLVLAVQSVNGQSSDGIVFPEKVRVRVPSASGAGTGDFVQLRARLFPPAGPVAPGGYDFSFWAFFSGIGATGFAFGAPKPLAPPDDAKSLWFSKGLSNVRQMLASRISATIGEGREAALAVALLVGDRSAISDETEANLRQAGLAHILAISGLHMALFAGGAYAVCLGLLALFPSLVLKYPIHKIAALAALSAAVFYLLLSGASVATQRSFLMISIVFLGILAGRRGLTLRSVAIAGVALLALAPERLFHPGFQMSFAAVIALVAVYDIWRDSQRSKWTDGLKASFLLRTGIKAGQWIAALFVTALVAGLATGIVGAYHFGRIAPFGLLGNMLGMPVFSMIVMPMGVLALALMPFGLAALPLTVMAAGLSLVMDVAEFTSELGRGAGAVGRIPAVTAVFLLAGLFLAVLLPGQRRFLCLLPLLVGGVALGVHRPPDVQISADLKRIAARDEYGVLSVSTGRKTFQNDIWLQAEGGSLSEIKSRKMKSRQRRCDDVGCVVLAYPADPDERNPPKPYKIALPKTAEAALMDCRFADMIVSDKIDPGSCEALVLPGHARRPLGSALSLWLDVSSGAEDGPFLRLNAILSGKTGSHNNHPASHTFLAATAYAVSRQPRPWHRLGGVTRQSLRSQGRAR